MDITKEEKWGISGSHGDEDTHITTRRHNPKDYDLKEGTLQWFEKYYVPTTFLFIERC